MERISSSEQGGSLATRRYIALALVGVLLLSTVGGIVGSSGIVAAQVNGSAGNNTTTGTAPASGVSGGSNTTTGNFTTASAPARNASGGNNSTAANPVNATIQEFKRQNLGYANLSSSKKQEVRSNLQQLYQGNVSQLKENRLIGNVQTILSSGPLMSPGEYNKPKDIIKNRLNASSELTTDGDPTDSSPLSRLDLPSMIETKMKSIADTLRGGAANILTNVYNLAFQTPVPENNGWQGIFGTPTNEPFQQLHQQLLDNRLYPVTNYLLSIGVLMLGVSLVVNPLMSKFRILDLIIKFVTFLMLYAFSWGAVTLMHGVVNDITMWIRPTPEELSTLVTNVSAMSAGAIGAYFAGSGGILATVFSLGLELGLRQVLLKFFFPYVFAPLLLMLYISPWQRLKSYASMAIWQYVNILTMVIPMAIVLKAAAIVGFNPGNGVAAMLVLIALFLVTASIPFVSTWFFLQIPGKAARGAKSAAVGAASRVDSAKEKMWGSDDSSDSTATGNTSPGDRTEAAVAASNESSSGLSSSGGKLSEEAVEQMDPAGNSQTTAAKVRGLDQRQHSDPMNPSAMKQAYFDENQANKPAYSTRTAD